MFVHISRFLLLLLIEQPVGPGGGVLGDLVAVEVYMYFMCGYVYVFVFAFVFSICIFIFICIFLYI